MHIQLRRSMSEELFIATAWAHGGWRCTYCTMRRSMRALINNRIAGGRLNFGEDRTWQSILAAQTANVTKANFANQHVGRGGPGGVAISGFGNYEVNPGAGGVPTRPNLRDQFGYSNAYIINRNAAGQVTDIDNNDIWLATNWIE